MMVLAFLWGTIFSVEKELFEKVGCFDEQFTSWGGEDIDLGFRLHKANSQFHLFEGIEGVHLSHPENDEINYKTNLENKRYISEKYNDEMTDWLIKEENIFKLNELIILKNTEKRMFNMINVAIAGIGNCCSSLYQGINYHLDSDPIINDLGISIKDINVKAAYDIDCRKVGLPISKAIFTKPNL
ncbi:galactosyltransferase-related protein [Xenorhabdus sp. SGI246]|uniref:galactosyltransferase-related protein n=1 Tax=Xenorhabdus sp. SGI246 TaxID=3158263 RepID=UPI00349FA63B